ncbi:MAG: hypothetical protein ABR520_00650 [Mycobacteriales bacterium]|nr:hypothetical protein [Frankia sp.]
MTAFRRAAVALAAASLLVGGGALLGTASAADCPAYPDAAGDAVFHEPVAGTAIPPLTDSDLDIKQFAVSSDADGLNVFITVAKLAGSPTIPTGDEFEFNAKLNDKTIDAQVDRFGGALGPVVSAIDGSPLGTDASPVKATGKFDTASNTVTVTIATADLDKAAGATARGLSVTAMKVLTAAHLGVDVANYDTATAPADATHKVGTTCTFAVAQPEPSGGGSEEPSEEPSGSESPTEEPSGGPSIPSGLTLRASRTTINAGDTIDLAGRATDAAGGASANSTVAIEARNYGSNAFVTIAEVVTDHEGNFFLKKLNPIRAVDYRARTETPLGSGEASASPEESATPDETATPDESASPEESSAPESPTAQAGTSNVVHIAVRAVIGVASPRSGTVLKASQAPVVTGGVSPINAGVKLGLQSRKSGKFFIIATGTVARDGSFVIRRYKNTPLPKGTYTLSVTMGATRGNSRSTSKEFILYVR